MSTHPLANNAECNALGNFGTRARLNLSARLTPHHPQPLDDEYEDDSEATLQILDSRQHDQIADGHVGWARQYKQNCFGDIFGAQPFA